MSGPILDQQKQATALVESVMRNYKNAYTFFFHLDLIGYANAYNWSESRLSSTIEYAVH